MPAGTPNSRRGKNSSLTVVLKLSSNSLAQFTKTQTDINRSSPTSSSELPVRPSSADNGSDANSTPATGAPDTPRRKGVPGPKPGNKRTNGQTDPKSRGRPGPKKKPKL